jgi:hypothetical protein
VQPPTPAPSVSAPGQFTLPAGAWIKVRVDQDLSSDRNRPGDAFTATLVQPLVVDGFVIARRGQTVGGQVTEAQKAGRARGTSRLGVELTEVSLVDGQQLPVRTQLILFGGGTSVGDDVTAIGTASGLGAAIGAAADGGFGAGMGAIAGAAASTIGVLATRGRATVIYPEAELTFRTTDPVTVSTDRAPHAFLPVRQEDYEPSSLQRRAARPTLRRPPYYGGLYYGGWYYPHIPLWYGPSFFYMAGPRFYRSRGYYHRW